MVRRPLLRSCVVVSLVVAVAGFASAQSGPGGSGPGEPNGPGGERNRPIPVFKYTVASPRACLIGPPIWSTAAYYMPSGDAENFARRNGTIRVLAGTTVVFCLSRDLEGVWYTGSYGCLGTSLVVQYCKLCKCIDPALVDCPETAPDPNRCEFARCACEQCRQLGAVGCPRPDDPVIRPCPWVTIGRDGAKDCRRGPSIGRAKIGVPVRFRRPGVYLLRAIVHTFARPGYPRPIDDWRLRLTGSTDPTVALPEIQPAEDRDVIYVRVRVVDCIDDAAEPIEPVPAEPDYEHIRPIPKDVDPNGPVASDGDLNGDLNGDETVNWADLAIMAQQWGKQYEMPWADDE